MANVTVRLEPMSLQELGLIVSLLGYTKSQWMLVPALLMTYSSPISAIPKALCFMYMTYYNRDKGTVIRAVVAISFLSYKE